MTVLQTLDWLVIAGYFAIVLGLAWWVMKKQQKTSTDYFLAGRHLGWFVVGASIFASNIGSEHLVGLAGSGATDGVAMAHYELHAWCLLILGWVMVPFYMRSKVFTMPEFLERRFNPRARTVLSAISLVAYVLTKIAVGVFAGGVVFSVLLPEMNFMGMDSFWIGSILVIVITGLYTVVGGMTAVAYTEALQTIILIIGSALVTFFGLEALGGWGELKSIVGSEMFNLWKPLVPNGVEGTWAPVKEVGRMAWYFNDNYPWIGMLFAAPIIGLWYWTTDQYIVQRTLSAPNETEARRGSIAASFFKLLPVFIFIIPGIISYALAVSGKIPALQSQLIGADGKIIRDNAQQAFPLMVAYVLPVGVRGMVVAGLLAALMSSLAGVFNACSTLFTIDFYQKLRPNVSQEKLVWVGRVATVVMVIIGLMWLPVIRGGKGLYDYLQGIQAYLAPPIFVVFFAGVFHKRLNAKGALAALYTGFALGLIRLAIDTPVKLVKGFSYSEGSLLWIINNIFFQYYGLLIFIVSLIVMVVVSYMSEVPDYAKISGLTFGTRTDEQKKTTRESWSAIDVIASGIVLALILIAYIYFSG
ncbi:MAG: Na+/glucose cotransporter [Stygiobacter sp. RIFOXYC12_FULL_38_8]|nr:MAG: Na+/glucose cotransporter [Stygiobacter sp. GWC2_38_9]OGU82013.1 MAG: Na+/glucose cotransporter [Stygiobacter sp. RIFOXYA12_FULL_38_9]OGV09213.1 MAG: Na+/glucose cotransporter [Stygiobacter sp. RIFOXYB2_FULL_37_11]OGV10631.1 MAG: Na+/glucose cotransporter [Stygiobacter sp. RIFOXYA2_FULL_38_8]OGV13829.1 MAG: Na+/glucose cotransporter [Stygiobacter sp. RIFOXYC2_FULL_38_25]OGV22245.1 MAG: Na+/glucose cotransporter [Stygiobacter sp. RIFOXYC12_FULL_38_8]OGV80213.1 MAG: Na+/glucose cotransp